MNRIKEVLGEKGLKQKWLAEKIGMTTVMINLYSNNRRQPKLTTLIKISDVLEVDISKIIEAKVDNNIIP
jgi:transcriptional regulator with XRE-family HTH domain